MVALIAANLVPVIGVIFFGWEVFPLVFLFWSENVIIGVFNAGRMLVAQPSSAAGWAGKLFLVPFFCFHYGMFTFVHGMFVLALFGGGTGRPHGPPGAEMFLRVIRDYHLMWAVLGLFVSHGVSFVTNFIRNGEFRRVNAGQLMGQPYGRIVVLHIAILGGGLLMAKLKSPTAGLVLLIVLKILLDVSAHLAERKKFASRPAESAQPAA